MSLDTVTVPYVELDQFKDELGIKVAVDDDRITRALATASEVLNKICDRDFHVLPTGSDEERYFSPDRPRTLTIDDLVEIHEFAIDRQGNDFATPTLWLENRDYVLKPENAARKGRPFERVKVMPYGRYLLPDMPRSVRISGVYGWPAVPDAITQATMLLANRLRVRKDAPFGIASFGTDVAMRVLRSDPDIELAVLDLVRDSIVYA